MNVYLPIELKSRELESKLLLGLEAARRGHQVLLGPLSIVFTWGPNGLLKPGVFHDKSLHPEVNYPVHARIKKNEGIITSLDEESGLLDKSYSVFAKNRFSNKSLSLVSKVFCWGSFDSESLEQIYPKYSNVIHNTGSPRVDLWRPEFNNFYRELNRSKVYSELNDYILLVSNLGLVLSQNRFWKLYDFSRQNGDLANTDNEFKMFDHYSHEIKMLREYAELIEFLTEKFPDKPIVIRPHPVEDEKGWSTLMAPFKNVRVIRKGSINEWVNKARVIIHNGCTTAFEARVNKKPLIAYRPIKSELEREIPNSLSYSCFNKEEVERVILNCYMHEDYSLEYSKASNKLLSDRLVNTQGDFAYMRIVDEWETLETQRLCEKNNWAYISAKLRVSSTKKKFVRTLQPHSSKQKFLTHHKFDSLEKSEILNYIQAYSTINRDFKSIKVKKIFNKTFLLSK